MSGRGRRPPLRNVLFALYALVCLAAMTWPVYARFGNSIEPYVLGIPWSFAWVVGWVLLSFLVLVVFHFVSERARGR